MAFETTVTASMLAAIKAVFIAAFGGGSPPTSESDIGDGVANSVGEAVTQALTELDNANEGWVQVAGGVGFAGAWTNYGGSTWATAAYYKDAFDRVHLRGMVKSGSIPGPIFYLPAAYRPPKSKLFACMTSSEVIGRVDIGYVDGAVYAFSGNNGYVSLDGISFRV